MLLKKKLNTFMADMELVRILIKYPKLIMCVGIGLYVMTFDSVRQSILRIIKRNNMLKDYYE